MKQGIGWGMAMVAGMLAVWNPVCAKERTDTVEGSDLRNQVVGSMLLTGKLVVGADGAINAYAIDGAHKVPPQVLQHVARHVPSWRVMKTGGIPVEQRFSVRIMATPQGGGNYALSLVGAAIARQPNPEEDIAVVGRRERPEYPRAHRNIGVSGTVYMALKVGRDGKVQDLMAEQVNLDFVGSPAEVAQVRADFAAHTAAAVRRWKFRLPASGPLAAESHVVVRVPVRYTMEQVPGYGEWEYYVPGPQRAAPWSEQDGMAIGAGEAGVPKLVGVGPYLEMPLEPRRGLRASGAYTIP